MTSKPKPLLNRSPLLPDESLPSFLFRLAHLNHYLYAPGRVVELCRERLTEEDNPLHPLKGDTFQVLAELTQVEADELYAASINRFAGVLLVNPNTTTLPSGRVVPILGEGRYDFTLTWPHLNSQFCPLCLAESAHHRIDWMPVIVSVCLSHRCLLVRGCPECGHKIEVQDILNRTCAHCRFNLVKAPVTSVADDAFGLFSQAAIQYWLGTSPQPEAYQQYGLPDQPPPFLVNLLEGLYRSIGSVHKSLDYTHHSPAVGSLAFRLPHKKESLTPTHYYLLYATAFKGLVNWPEDFHKFLDAYRRRDNLPPTDRIYLNLGALYTYWLERLWRKPEFRFVQEAFEAYLNRPGDTTVVLRRTAELRPPYMTETEAIEALDISPDLLKFFIRSGLVVNLASNKPKLVWRAGVEELQSRWIDGITLADAAWILSVSDEIASSLVKAGLVALNNKQTITDFLTTLVSRAQTFRPQYTSKLVNLEAAVRLLDEHGLDAGDVMKRILAGELRCCWFVGEGGLDRLNLYQAEVDTLVEGVHTNGSFLTTKQVAKLLGVRQRDLKEWIQAGLLMPFKQGRRLFFEKETVREFAKRQFDEDEAARVG